MSNLPYRVGIPMVGADSSGEQWPARLLGAHNIERSKAGLAPFAGWPRLDLVAQARVEDMVRGGYFAHVDPDNTPGDYAAVLAQHGIRYAWAGENLAANNYSDDAVTRAMVTWMNSPTHRDNVLFPGFDTMGGAAAVRPDGAILMAVVFVGGAAL
ncbi:MAG: hypothetical protein C0506_06615 [Anaerolinea sp.]|nr:hypothetical protein [Anaerolinea sp.]